jgi:hypothetical protein
MGIIGSLFGDENEASPEVENETVDQVVEDTPEPEMEDEEIESTDDHAEHEDVSEPETGEDESPAKHRQTMVPVGAVKAEREKRQEAERRAAEYQAQLDHARSLQRQPDEYSDDPYFNSFREKVRAEMFDERLLDSDERAREKHGAEMVAEAAEWAKSRMATDPTLKANFLNSRKPMEMIVERFQQDQKVNALLTDEEAYIRRRAAEMGLFADHTAASADVETDEAPAVVTTKPAAKATPRRSLAGGQSQGRATDVPAGRNSAVGSLFS